HQPAPPASSSADQAQAPTGDTTAATVAVRTATKAAGPRVSGPVAQTASSQPASVSPAVRPARDTAWASRNARVAGASESADQAQPSPGSMAAGVSAFLRASDQGAAPAPAGTAAPEAAQTTRAMIADQVVSVVLSNRSDHSQQVTIRLDPPELGTIHLSLQTDKDMVRGVVRVDNPETFKQLQRETPQLIERLVEGGIQVKHIDVQMNTNGGGTPSGWQGANGGGWEQFAQGRGPAGGGVTTGPVSQAALDSPPQAADAGVFTADSVNLWL
ncbi:MAG: flagellar hook-length control protein FliK, partial [Planctomycetota bacterium]|nr:flagellar hook-length control protein FliK [Planctomycetota bacterium]